MNFKIGEIEKNVDCARKSKNGGFIRQFPYIYILDLNGTNFEARKSKK